jgi:methyltransferase
MLFFSLILFLLIQRVTELCLAGANRKWIERQGGYEVGQEHYKFLVGLHLCFLLSLSVEVLYHQTLVPRAWAVVPFSIFILAQLARVWVIRSLGRFWNTRIMILPTAVRMKKGPYRYLKHPNYWVVAVELLTIPLMFQAYFTATVFTILNALLLLFVRIPVEERALKRLKEHRLDRDEQTNS